MTNPEPPPFPYHHLGVYEGRLAGTAPSPRTCRSGKSIHLGMNSYTFSGRMACILEESHGERVVELRAGEACIVPQGVWHRLLVREPGDLLFLTPAEGTMHRPIPSH